MTRSAPAWQPTATLATLRTRARMLAQVRTFFAARGVLEVETPTIVSRPVSEPHLANVSCRLALQPERSRFLRTSPEYHMKRLLAAGSPDIFEICKVFRDGEFGPRHSPEFTMIEWYRHDFTMADMVAETCALIDAAASAVPRQVPPPRVYRYAEIYQQQLGLNPLAAATEDIVDRARELLGGRVTADLAAQLAADREAWLDLLMVEIIEPALQALGLVVIERYPAAQAALARLDPDDLRVAERFEVFLDGFELANGYRELSDAAEQRRRFANDRTLRRQRHLPDRAPDAAFLAALDAGLPDCAGVALGVDRLLMACLGLTRITDAMSFAVPDPD
jgi:lysyl-tRNA synthetase class 2